MGTSSQPGVQGWQGSLAVLEGQGHPCCAASGGKRWVRSVWGALGEGGAWGQPGTCPCVLRCWHTQPSISARHSSAAACPRRDLGDQNPEGTRL